MVKSHKYALIVFGLWLLSASSLRAQNALDAYVSRLRQFGELTIAGETVFYSPVLAGVYERSGFKPLWNTPATSADLVRLLHAIENDGLDPADYHATAIERLGRLADDSTRVQLDLLKTSALIRVAYDLHRGRVDSRKIVVRRDYAGPLHTGDPVEELSAALKAGRLYDDVLRLRPNHFVYTGLLNALSQLRSVAAVGGWARIPDEGTLRPDSLDPRVPLLRQRLQLEGDLLDAGGQTRLVYDDALQQAVREFQHRHGLNSDGVVGPATFAALNTTVGDRITQIRVNLERARWITQDLPETFIAVNVAGAMVYYVRAGSVVFETRAVVGKQYTATPIFRAALEHIEVNPTWTVPPGIVAEVLRATNRNPNYLRDQNIRVLTHSGQPINADRLNFSSYTARSFPYVLRQEPGALNPLGRIKLVFPNPYNVYLHDTPSRALFDQEHRLFSHGCIRVSQPVRLASFVARDTAWNERTLQEAIDSGETRRIAANPIPVLILYWTASADLDGELHFYRDVYSRDGALLKALDSR